MDIPRTSFQYLGFCLMERNKISATNVTQRWETKTAWIDFSQVLNYRQDKNLVCFVIGPREVKLPYVWMSIWAGHPFATNVWLTHGLLTFRLVKHLCRILKNLMKSCLESFLLGRKQVKSVFKNLTVMASKEYWFAATSWELTMIQTLEFYTTDYR